MKQASRNVICLLASLTLMSSNALALIDCAGEVSSLSLQLNTSGTVTLSLTGGPTSIYLCDVDGDTPNPRNSVSPTVCRTMYATLVAARTTGKKVSIRFYDYNSCAAIPSWTNAGGLGWTVLLTD